MSVLHFRVEIETDPRNVGYVRHLLNSALRRGNALELFPLTKVFFEGEFDVQAWAERIEKDAFDRGEIDL